VAASTADINTFKNLINSTLSTTDAAMMMLDIKNYYLGTPLHQYEYMRMLLSIFPEEILNTYNITVLAVDGKGHVWIETSSITSQSAPKEASINIWLLSRSPHTGSVDT
jgi:hypothetical protein